MSVPQLMDELKMQLEHGGPNAAINVHSLLGQTSLSDISKTLVVITLCWPSGTFLSLLQILVSPPPNQARGARPFPTSYFAEEYFNTLIEQPKNAPNFTTCYSAMDKEPWLGIRGHDHASWTADRVCATAWWYITACYCSALGTRRDEQRSEPSAGFTRYLGIPDHSVFDIILVSVFHF